LDNTDIPRRIAAALGLDVSQLWRPVPAK